MSIEFRIQLLSQKEQKYLKEMVTAPESYVELIAGWENEEDCRKRMKSGVDFFLSYKRFSEKLNDLFAVHLYCMRNTDKQAALNFVRDKFC